MMGAGFPVMAWWGIEIYKDYWSTRLSGAKLEREKTAWEAVLAEILSAASPDSRVRHPRILLGIARYLMPIENKSASNTKCW